MQLVVLAAGHGRRFGGLKQLAPVGPNGESIMDYTARSAERCGFSGIVLIVRAEIREEVAAHVQRAWPRTLPVELVEQMPIAGTAPAVLSARSRLDGAFAVANADDLYGEQAIERLRRELATAATSKNGQADHVMVAYRLANTVLTDAPVTRGICEQDGGYLVRILEQSVRRRADGDFDAAALGADRRSDPAAAWDSRRGGDELVSMNLWGFQPSILDALEEAVAAGPPSAGSAELLLPDVVGNLVASGRQRLRVVSTDARCIGLTHPDDIELVRRAIATELEAGSSAGSGAGRPTPSTPAAGS